MIDGYPHLPKADNSAKESVKTNSKILPTVGRELPESVRRRLLPSIETGQEIEHAVAEALTLRDAMWMEAVRTALPESTCDKVFLLVETYARTAR